MNKIYTQFISIVYNMYFCMCSDSCQFCNLNIMYVGSATLFVHECLWFSSYVFYYHCSPGIMVIQYVAGVFFPIEGRKTLLSCMFRVNLEWKTL